MPETPSPSHSPSLPLPVPPTLPLADCHWLARWLGHPELRILDASWYMPASGRDGRREYAAAHIPGAIFADIDWLSDTSAPYPHTLPSPEVLGRELGQLGVGSDYMIVVYDGSSSHFSAPRLWYMIRSLGHERVAVLNGGLPRWKAAGFPLSSEIESLKPTVFMPRSDSHAWRNLRDMRANLETQHEQVVDARSHSRFTAEEAEPRAGVRGGHIPGACNVHYASLTTADGTFKSPAELRAQFESEGLNLAAPITCSCGSGVTACTVALGLTLAGARQVAIYDGSWTEWGSQPDTAVETGTSKKRSKTASE